MVQGHGDASKRSGDLISQATLRQDGPANRAMLTVAQRNALAQFERDCDIAIKERNASFLRSVATSRRR